MDFKRMVIPKCIRNVCEFYYKVKTKVTFDERCGLVYCLFIADVVRCVKNVSNDAWESEKRGKAILCLRC